MNRREMLLSSAALLGLSGLSPVMAALNAMSGAKNESFTSVFTELESQMLAVLVDLYIPKTDTPSASEAGAVSFIEELVTKWYDATEQEHFLQGFALINNHCQSSFSKSFLECDAATQIIVLEDAQDNALGSLSDATPGLGTSRRSADPTDWALWGDKPRAGGAFFLHLKGLVTLAYYTSEIGATQALIYDPVPGEYDGNFDFDKVGKHFTS